MDNVTLKNNAAPSYIGIIYIYTSPSGKVYVGQTINEKVRKYQHKWYADNGYSGYFYKAIRKYGFESFEYGVLYQTSSNDKKQLKILLDQKESYYIRKYKANNPKFGYNLTEGGEGTKGSGIEVLLTKDDETLEFRSITDAGKYLGVKYISGLSEVLRGRAKSYKGYTIRYKDESRAVYKPEPENISRVKQMLGAMPQKSLQELKKEIKH